MNKNVKWTIISVSTAVTLLFGGLVASNQTASNNTNNTDGNNSTQNNYSSSNDNKLPSGDSFSEGNNESNYDQNFDEWDFSQDFSDKDSKWGQDQFRQAPSNGFEQGHGSSGASK